MPYEGPGVRHTAEEGLGYETQHGQIVYVDGFVGSAFKVGQPDRFVRPEDAPTIEVDEEFEVQLGGIHEAPRSGALAALNVGDDVYITKADSVLVAAATALTAGALEPEYAKVGKVTEIDFSRTPDVLRINGNFLEWVAG